MDELIRIIANDLSVLPYEGETDANFMYRVFLSSLGMHGLMCSYVESNEDAISKSAITSYINDIADTYMLEHPAVKPFFKSEKNDSIGKLIRTIYGELGYLVEDPNGLSLSRYGRELSLNDRYLYFGIPNEKYVMNGLGVVIEGSNNIVEPVNKIILRDTLTIEEYIENNFQNDEFKEIDFDYSDVSFFNALCKFNNHSSWQKNDFKTDYSLCQFNNSGIYYKAKREDNQILISRISAEQSSEQLDSREYRRLYFALKNYYKNSSIATCKRIDKNYSELKLTSKLPNREYYLMMLIAWPCENVFNETKFLIDNRNIGFAKEMISKLGIKVMEVSK